MTKSRGIKTIKQWTRKEERTLLSLRAAKHSVASCASLLGRTYGSVAVRLSLLNGTKRLKKPRRAPGQFDAEVRKYHAQGMFDPEIAELIGTVAQLVYRSRKRQGLPSNCDLATAARLAVIKRKTITAECMGCGKTALTVHLARLGWILIQIGGTNSHDAHCPKCVKEYGIPEANKQYVPTDLPETRERSTNQILLTIYRRRKSLRAMETKMSDCPTDKTWPEIPPCDSLQALPPIGKPSWNGISELSKVHVGDCRDTPDPSAFNGSYEPLPGERIAGHKNPPPPGSDKKEE